MSLKIMPYLSLFIVSVIDKVWTGLDPVKLVVKPGSSGPLSVFLDQPVSPLCSVMG